MVSGAYYCITFIMGLQKCILHVDLLLLKQVCLLLITPACYRVSLRSKLGMIIGIGQHTTDYSTAHVRTSIGYLWKTKLGKYISTYSLYL